MKFIKVEMKLIYIKLTMKDKWISISGCVVCTARRGTSDELVCNQS